MSWRRGKFLEESIERVERIDKNREVFDRNQGDAFHLDEIRIGESRELELAILNIDIDDYRNLTRELSVTQVSRLLSLFLSEMTHVTKEYGGNVEKFVDSKLTAMFAGESNASRACHDSIDCALSMLTDVEYAINPYLKKIGLPSFGCAAGIDFGYVRIERVGVKDENQYCVVGSTLDIAQDLEELAEKNRILVGQDVFRNLDEKEKERCRLQQFPSSWRWKYGEDYYSYYAYVGVWNGYPLFPTYAQSAPMPATILQSELPREVSPPLRPSPRCPYCKRPLAYAPNHERWYCIYCQRYLRVASWSYQPMLPS
jgi:class 3 adenylate cyclase